MASIPGVPNLLRNTARAIVITLIGNAVGGLWKFLFPGPQWGVFLPGSADPAVAVSSVVELGASGRSAVSDYPLQSGSFTSYNKVQTPDLYGIRLTSDGEEQSRAIFMSWLETNKNQTTLFDIVCPERRWPNATLTDYRIIRTSTSGASMITVDCVFQQIRDLPATYSRRNIAEPENQPSSPTARVNVSLLAPESAGGLVSW
jgi:hypothetical protein